MATDVAPEVAGAVGAPPARSGLKLYRLTVEQYLRMADAGILDRGPRVELIGGALVEKMVKHDPHDFAVSSLGDLLRGILPPGWFVREEKSMNLDRWSRPEPDIVVARGTRADYRRRAPTPADVALVIEVADSSYAGDRAGKWRRYAAAEVATYGILNIKARRFELYRDPGGKGRSASYRGEASYDEGAEFPVVVDGREVGRIAVKDLLA